MGGGLSTVEEQYAFKISKKIYDITKNDLSDSNLYVCVNDFFNAAVSEFNLEIQNCRNSLVLADKYERLNSEEKNIFHKNVIDAITRKELIKAKSLKNSKAEDYSVSFSGTEADSKNEKEAANILRGNEDNTWNTYNNNDEPFLIPPIYYNINDYNYVRTIAKWCRFLGHKNCYLYINTLTKEIISIRPENYIDENINQESNNISKEEQNSNISNGLPIIELHMLINEVDNIVKNLQKTPLIIDGTSEKNVMNFFSYSGQLAVCYIFHIYIYIFKCMLYFYYLQ